MFNFIEVAHALTATTTYTIVSNPSQDNAMVLLAFAIFFWGIVFLFKK